MTWYWEIWLLVAFAIIALVWKLVWLIIRSRTQYVFLKFIDSASNKPVKGMVVYASIVYFPDLHQLDLSKDLIQLKNDFALKRIGATDIEGCLRYRNRWLNIHQLIIPEYQKVYRYNDVLFEFRSFASEPQVIRL